MSYAKRLFCALGLSITLACPLFGGNVSSFDDIENWSGTGANQAALVIDWHNGESNSAMVWGVRFDGTLDVSSALSTIAQSDSKLYAAVNDNFWMAFGYDQDAAGAQGMNIPASANTPFTATDGIVSYDEAWSMPGSTALDANDFYGSDSSEVSTSWGLYLPSPSTASDNGTPDNYWDDYAMVSTADTYEDITFIAASVGASSARLEDGSWAALSFGTFDASWNHEVAPSTSVVAAPIPEPATMSLLTLGLVGLARRKRKQ